MARAFVSHSHDDKVRFVNHFAERLSAEGVEVWYDTWALRPGDSLTQRIFNEGLAGSDVVIVVLSVNSVDSNWVSEELNIATVRRIRGLCKIIPVVIDDVDIPASLDDILYLQIPNTRSYDREFDRIMDAISGSDGGADLSGSTMDAARPDAPHLLPTAPRRFVNRESELARLDDFLEESSSAPHPCVAVVVGMPGVGKSALAAHWSHSVRERFADGGLYVDFAPRGLDAGPDISDILASLLRDLGVEDEAIPTNLESQTATFRRLTASKRLLMVADNVSEAAQVNRALPSGRGSVVVATANAYIGELEIDGAEMVELQALDRSDAVAVLRAMAGPREGHGADEDWDELSDVCGGLPIALAVSGTRLRRHPTWSVRDLIHDIRSAEDPLVVVAGNYVRSLKRSLDAVYRSFDRELRCFYRRLGLFPGPTLRAPSSAVIVGVSQRDADRMLQQLHDAQLLIEVAPHRYVVHNLVFDHMKSSFASAEPAGAAEELAAGLIEWYCGAVRGADRAIAKERLRLAADEEIQSPVEFPKFSTPSEAYDWYMAERYNIVAVVRLADSLGRCERVWQMAESLWLLFLNRRMFADWRECDRLGVDAAKACGHRDAEARLRSHLARVLAELGEHEQAGEEMSLAMDLVATSDNLALRASIRESEGTCVFLAGDNRAAMEAFDSVRAQMKVLGRARSVAIADLLRSRVFNAEGRFSEALNSARSCQATFEQLGDEVNAAKAALEAARASVRSRSDDDVVLEVQRTVGVLHRLGLDYHSAQAHELAARALDERSRSDDAMEHRRAAYRLYKDLGHENAERLQVDLHASRG